MATVTQTLDVSTIDEDGKTTTFKLDNFKENITKNQVVEAFQYGINNGLLMSNYGTAIKSVGTVMKSTSTKVELEGEPIYITPNELTLTIPAGNPHHTDTTITVANAAGMVQAASVVDVQSSNTEATYYAYIASLTESAGVYSIVFRIGTEAITTITGRINIIINGTNNYVPFTATR